MIVEPIIPRYKGGSVGGGGRYDNLIENLVGTPMAATGIAFGFDRILEALEELNKFPEGLAQPSQVLVTVFSTDDSMYATSIFRLLQKNNISVELYSDPSRKIEAQIKYAVAKKIPYVIIAGPDEQKNRLVTVKNLATREQNSVDFSKLLGMLTAKKR
jgi:histidyl-tRNA synthetase